MKNSGDAATSTSTMERPTYEDLMPGNCKGLYTNTNWSGKSAAAAVALLGQLDKDGFIPSGQTRFNIPFSSQRKTLSPLAS